MFKPGSIRKIEVKNFVTYTYTELYPGPNLNMILGPNGTGKSTMVAAIILGLGGNPKVVGRGKKISEYVKHNCDQATINIYLQGEKENKFLKITRVFDTHEKTTWKINGNNVLLNQVLDNVKKYNIQVDNLCQFLPQDRVQDFAKLNKQELLKQTQLALCRHDLIEKQEILVNSLEKHKELAVNLEKHSVKLQEAQDANARLEGRVKNFNKKKKYSERISHIDRKIAWLKYEEARSKLTEVKEDKIKATEVYEKYKNATKPLEKEIAISKKSIVEVQDKNTKLYRVVRNAETAIDNNIEKVENAKKSVRKINNDTTIKIAEIEQRAGEIQTLIAKLEEMKTARKEIISKCDDGAETQQSITSKIQKLNQQYSSLEDKKEEVVNLKQNTFAQIRAKENEISRLENIKQQRLQRLQRTDQDAYNAVIWLRQNKHMFQGEIFEPMMLEVNVLESKNAIYVENVIPMRDRLAFTCVNKDDMNQLIRCLREKQGLSISVLHSGNSDGGLNEFQPNIPIENLKRFGFYTYLHSLITAPEPIMRYLCKTYKIHNIPIGNSKTNGCYEQVPPEIRQFFSDKFRYSISFSKYTSMKSSRQMEISSDGGLSISLDVIRLEHLRGECNEIKLQSENYDGQLQLFNTQLEKLNEASNVLKNKLKDIKSLKNQVVTIDNRIQNVHLKIEDLNRCNINQDTIKKEAVLKIKRVLEPMHSIQKVIRDEFKSLSSLIPLTTLNAIKVENLRKQAAYLENKANDTRQLFREAEDTLNKIKDTYNKIMTDAKALLNNAKSLSNGCTPSDEGFEEFKEIYENLSADSQELLAEKQQITSHIDCLNTADDSELKEYEDRLKLIEKLQNDIQRSHAELESITSKLGRLQEDWLVPLGELISEINYKFGAAFERMGCAGEIAICKGENEQDFSQYGISIKVTYRNGEPLQELNTVVQSGGERAVATATFMLSLQELTPVPFRCVDEINQGMDANNERRIFDLLVETTSQTNTAQYFLITPKLVPNLKYSRSMMVHIVHNGPFVVQDRKWAFSKICNPQGTQIH